MEALPSLRIGKDRLDYEPGERAGLIRLSPNQMPAERSRQPEPQPVTQAPPPARQLVQQTIFVPQPQPPAPPEPEPILETYYVSPIYTAIIVMNPPEKKPSKKKKTETSEH
jgi:hypothetical protein